MKLEGRPTKESCYRPYYRLQAIVKKERGTMLTAVEYATIRGCTLTEIEKKLSTIYNH